MIAKSATLLRHVAMVALVTAVQVANASGQSIELRGRAVDPQGAPVAGLEVLLHRVAGGSGANIARDTTGEDGSFRLTAEGPAPDSAVFFAAARYRNELFVGEFVRPPFDAGMSYTLVVGGQPFSMDSPLPVSPTTSAQPAPTPSSSWILLLVPVLVLAGVVYAVATRSSRPTRYRRLLIRLAAFDEDAAAAAVDGDGASPDEAARRERERIMERLLSP
jgi:hypothetical protein